jgi:hypothetical protein
MKLFERNDVKKNTGTGDVAAKQRYAYILSNSHRHNGDNSLRMFSEWILNEHSTLSEARRHAKRILNELECE